MSWWPFSKSKKATENASQEAFQKLLDESKARTDDLEKVVVRLRENRERIHKRAEQLLGEENVVTRQALKSTPG